MIQLNDSQQEDYLKRDEDKDSNYLSFSRTQKIKQGTNEAWAFEPNMLALIRFQNSLQSLTNLLLA